MSLSDWSLCFFAFVCVVVLQLLIVLGQCSVLSHQYCEL